MIFGQHSSRNQRAKGLKSEHSFKIAFCLAFCVWLIYKMGNAGGKRNTYIESSPSNHKDGDENLNLGRKMKFEFIERVRTKSDDKITEGSIGEDGAENDELPRNTDEKEEDDMDIEHKEAQRSGTFISENGSLHEEILQNDDENSIVVRKEEYNPLRETQREGQGSSDDNINDAEEDAKELVVRGQDIHIDDEGEKEFQSQVESGEKRERKEADNSEESIEQETSLEKEAQSHVVDIADIRIAGAERVERKQENEEVDAKSEENADVTILNEEGQNDQETADEKEVNGVEDKSESDKTKDLGKDASEEKEMRRLMEEKWSDTAEMESQTNSSFGDITVNHGLSDLGSYNSLILNEAAGETQTSRPKEEIVSRSSTQHEYDKNLKSGVEEISNRSLQIVESTDQILHQTVENQEVNETVVAAGLHDPNYDTEADEEVTIESVVIAKSNTDMPSKTELIKEDNETSSNETPKAGNDEG